MDRMSTEERPDPPIPAQRGRKWLLPGAAIALGLAIVVQGGLLAAGLAQAPKPLADVRAVDHTGKPAKMSDFRGKWVVVFFGYTRCPDICPTSLSQMAKVLRQLGPEAKKVQGLFVSVDPGRDKVKNLGGYVTHFDKRLVGWSLEEPDLLRLLEPFHAPYATPDPSGGVEHSTLFYMVNPDGVLLDEALVPPLDLGNLKDLMARAQ